MENRIDREKVEKQAKEILDKFARALEKVEKEWKEEESYVDREEFSREEKNSECHDNKAGSSDKSNEDFRKKMLENAPNHDEDFIIAEKGAWK